MTLRNCSLQKTLPSFIEINPNFMTTLQMKQVVDFHCCLILEFMANFRVDEDADQMASDGHFMVLSCQQQ
jgi:hypothetical protein